MSKFRIFLVYFTMKTPLDEYRDSIDRLDKKLITLISERFELVEKIGEYKKKNNIPPLALERWKEVLAKLAANAEAQGVNPDLMLEIYELIHEQALIDEAAKIVYYLGPEGSYTHEAALSMLSFQNHIHKPLETFGQIRHMVLQSDCIGVLPIENSITSNVHENVDSLYTGDYKIIGEGFVDIKLNLIGLPGTKLDTIRTVYSHPKALEQSTKFTQKHKLMTSAMNSTSEAIKYVESEANTSIAAIGSSMLAKELGLDILVEDIGNFKNNQTRFIAIKSASLPPAEDKTEDEAFTKMSVIIELPHKTGSLHTALGEIAKVGGNLTKIESRPIPESEWSYNFLLDIEAEDLKTVKTVLKQISEKYTIIGEYNLLT